MKIKIILFFLFSVCIYSCNTKKNQIKNIANSEPQIADSIIYGFINFFIDHPEINPNTKCNEFINDKELGLPFPFFFKKDSMALTKMVTFLSKKDIEFIFSQRKKFEKFVLNPKLINHAKIINSESLSSRNQRFCTISYPLFNIDKTKVIIRTSYSDCSLCSVGGVFMYEKRNSKWILIKELNGWIN
jgi:hypothetical protein